MFDLTNPQTANKFGMASVDNSGDGGACSCVHGQAYVDGDGNCLCRDLTTGDTIGSGGSGNDTGEVPLDQYPVDWWPFNPNTPNTQTTGGTVANIVRRFHGRRPRVNPTASTTVIPVTNTTPVTSTTATPTIFDNIKANPLPYAAVVGLFGYFVLGIGKSK